MILSFMRSAPQRSRCTLSANTRRGNWATSALPRSPYDFTYGHEGEAGFQHSFEDDGGKGGQKLWSPLNAVDYGSYVAQIKTNVDAVYAGFAGVNGLLKQFNE